MATATKTAHDSTTVLVPLLSAAANVVATDPERPAGAEAVSQIRDTFTEFIAIVGEGDQILAVQQDRARRAAEWEDDKDCAIYTGVCLGAYRERSEGGGSVTRIAVWVRAFDKERMCDSYQDARELWRDNRSDPDAFSDKGGILYINGIKSARAPFGHEMVLDSPGRVIRAAKELQGNPVKMYRQLHEWDSDGYSRQVGVVHRIELNPDADDGAAADVEEAPATKRGGSKGAGSKAGSTNSRGKAGSTSTRGKAGSTSSRGKAGGSTSSRGKAGSRASKPDPEPQDDGDDVPESKQALIKWATGEGIKRGSLSRFLEAYGYEGGVLGLTDDDVAEAYEVILEGISNGAEELGV